MLLWFITVLILVMAVALLLGKGSFLIAGYNTASQKEKERYDEKKLCRVTGGGLLAIAAAMLLLAIFQEDPPQLLLGAFAAVTVGSCIAVIVLGNTVCKKKEAPPSGSAPKKSSRTARRLSWIAAAAVLALTAVLLFTGELSVEFQEDALDIRISWWKDQQVAYGEITSVELVSGMDTGKRTNGLGSVRLLGGNFRNDLLGDYLLFAYTGCDIYVLLHTDGKTVAVNARTPEETADLYEEILDRTNAPAA